MGRASVTVTFAGSVHEAETCWYDHTGWPAWVDGLERVLEVDPPWPEQGGRIVWESGPAGRGHVTEKVAAHSPLGGQTVDVDDDSILGRQSVSFTPADENVEVQLKLEYEIKRRSLFTPLVDWLFIRRAMETSLRTTLGRFGVELADVRAQTRERSEQ
jgi:hypothetical protein